MTDTPDIDPELSELARRLGQRGGRQTRRRGADYFARIGRLGAQKRWHGGDTDADATKRPNGDTTNER